MGRLTRHNFDSIELRPMARSRDPERCRFATPAHSFNTRIDFTVLLLLGFSYTFIALNETSLTSVAAGSEEFMQQANLTLEDITNSVSFSSASWVIFSFVTVISQRTSIKYYLAAQVTLTGGICAAHAAIRNRGTLIALRILMGMTEAGFSGSALTLLASYYPKFSLGLRLGIFQGAFTLGGAFGGLLSWGLLSVQWSGLASWQIVFIFEGLLTIILGLLILVVLPKELETAWFLNDEQRQDVSMGRIGNEGPTDQEPVSKEEILTVLKDWRIILLIASNICLLIPVTGLLNFSVPFIKGLGHSESQVNLMSIPPFVVATVTVILILYLSNRAEERPLFAIASVLVAIAGLVVVAISDNHNLRYIFLIVCSGGVFAPPMLSAAHLANMSPNARVRSVVMGINGFANVGSVIAGQVFQAKYAPTYKVSSIITASLLVLPVVSVLVVRFFPKR